MSEKFTLEVISPDRTILKVNAIEVVIPSYEGEIGILKDHISLISFLKPGIIKVFSKDGEEHFYVDDGIAEFKDNALSILTSSIFNVKDKDNGFIANSIAIAEKELLKEDLNDQSRFLINHKIDILKSLSVN